MEPHMTPRSGWYKMDLWRKRSLNRELCAQTTLSGDCMNTDTVPATPGNSYPPGRNERTGRPIYENELFSCETASSLRKGSKNTVHSIQKKLSPDKNGPYIKSTNKTGLQSNDKSNLCFSGHCLNAKNCIAYDRDRKSFFSRSRDSVTSDPEVYTKSHSSAEKLGTQIKRLKEEMLALRSSTVAFQQTMEKVLDELRWMKLVQQSGNQRWPCNGDYVIESSAFQRNKEENFAFSQKRSANGSMAMSTENFEPKSYLKKPVHNYHKIESLAKSSCANIPSNKYSNIDGVILTRPYSDLQVESNCRVSANNKNISEATSVWRASCPNKSTFPISKATQEHPKYYSVVPRNSKLRVSKCSIDSGYQDSSVLIPHEKSTRETFRNTPTSIASYLIANQTIPKLSIDVTASQTTPNLYVNLKKANIKKINSQRKAEKQADRFLNDANLVEEAPFSKNTQADIESSIKFENDSRLDSDLNSSKDEDQKKQWVNGISTDNHFIPLQLTNNKNNFTNKSKTNNRLIRPIPKQRTMFPPQKNVIKKVASDLDRSSSLDQEIIDRDMTYKEEHFWQDETKTNICEEGSIFLFDKLDSTTALNESNSFESQTPRSTRVSKAADTECPKLTLDECNSQLLGKVVLRKVKSKSQCSCDPKNLPKDKCYVTKKEILLEEERDESSVVRRRSMKLMQEFRVFDINKDSSAPPNSEKMSSFCDPNIVYSRSGSSDSHSLTPKTSEYFVSPPVAITSPYIGNTFAEQFARNGKLNPDKSYFPEESFGCRHRFDQDFNSTHQTQIRLPSPLDCFNSYSSHSGLLSTLSYSNETNSFPSSSIWSKPSIKEAHSQSSLYKGLKLNPLTKSAFKPVLASSTDASEILSPRNDPMNNTPFFKKRSSLPSAMSSNKQRYLNEFGLGSSNTKHHNGLNATLKVKPHVGSAETFETAETKATCYKLNISQGQKERLKMVSSPISKSANSEVSFSPRQTEFENRNPFVTSPRQIKTIHSELKHSSVTDNVDPVIWKTKESVSPNTSQNGIVSEAPKTFASKFSFPSARNHNGNTASPHQYETVKSVDFLKNGFYNPTENLKPSKNDISAVSCGTGEKKSQNKKSAVAFIKASFMGKRKKQKEKTKKQDHNFFVFRQDCAMAGENKIKREQSDATSTARNKKKKAKEKLPKPSIVGTLSKNKKRETLTNISSRETLRDATSVLPDQEKMQYGNADAEVMERFLEAAVASHHAPKSPLLKFRRSLRIPRNRNKCEQERRIKDDLHLDIRTQAYPTPSTSKSRNVHNGQEFTYV